MLVGRFRRSAASLAAAAAVVATPGCATLDAAAVAETHRLGDAPYYVELSQPQPSPGVCALVLPVALDPGLSDTFGYQVNRASEFEQPIRFLTAEDKPVEMLHLTGVLVDTNGRPVRAGAEGIVLRDTPFLAQAVDAVRVFDRDELQRVLTSARRGDLAGAPLALDVAFDNLLAQLTRGALTVPAR